MKKIKLLVTSSSFPVEPGSPVGGGIFIEKLSNELAKHFDLNVVTPFLYSEKKLENFSKFRIKRFKYFFKKGCNLTGGSGVFGNIKSKPIKAFKIPFFLFFQFITLFRTIIREKTDICHAHWLIPQAIQLVIIKKLLIKSKFKILLTIHGSDIYRFKSTVFRKLILWTTNNVDVITVVSNALKNELLDFGVEKDIYVYPMGVDMNLFKKLDIKQKENQILFVGSLLVKKGLIDLLDAFCALKKRFPKLELKIIGTGSSKYFENYAISLGVDKSVLWLGKVDNKELPIHYNEANIFILPSHSEGLGLVSIEAMACECTTVVSNLPSTREYIIPNETGFFIEAKSTKSITLLLTKLLDGTINPKNIVVQGRNYVEKRFSWKISVKNYIELINYLYGQRN